MVEVETMELSGNNTNSFKGVMQRLRGCSAARHTLYLALVLSVVQAFDGLLTSLGMVRFGPSMEANPLIRILIEEYGHIAALGITKILGIIVVITIALHANYLRWLDNAFRGIMLFYLFRAILPWTYVLFIA